MLILIEALMFHLPREWWHGAVIIMTNSLLMIKTSLTLRHILHVTIPY